MSVLTHTTDSRFLVFEEFHSQIPIESMLNYLDIYPLTLPARYSDRLACYTTVYITSNLSLEEQYRKIQRYQPETWRAFQRRIHVIREYRHDGTVRETIYETRRKAGQAAESGWPGFPAQFSHGSD
ncbi:hypothetical protein I4100191B2_22580 [Clostridiales bacterium]